MAILGSCTLSTAASSKIQQILEWEPNSLFFCVKHHAGCRIRPSYQDACQFQVVSVITDHPQVITTDRTTDPICALELAFAIPCLDSAQLALRPCFPSRSSPRGLGTLAEDFRGKYLFLMARRLRWSCSYANASIHCEGASTNAKHREHKMTV